MRARHSAIKRVCLACKGEFIVYHRSQRSKRYCSVGCASARPRSALCRQLLRANRISPRSGDPVDRESRWARELRRRLPDLVDWLEKCGTPLIYRFPIGSRHFDIAIPDLKILVDADAHWRCPSRQWARTYREAQGAGWKIMSDQEFLIAGMESKGLVLEPGQMEIGKSNG